MDNDPDPIPAGTCGTVKGVLPFADTWQIQVAWDVPRSLQLVCPPDKFTDLPRAAGSVLPA